MGIYNQEQALAQECIDRLGDKKPKVFGLYMGMIKKFGAHKVRQVMAEVDYQHRRGYIDNKPKLFMYLIKTVNK